ncbi:hypothetical protein Y032_0864g2754 [Ancylostoma ceylanicum]|uniref:BPTI/Kunitz inhibitor domain-containing protein n=1 Tax=Ancylostoma ceylanicum TaxID=53326 RepID=A0A016WA44_9BILA|nr:hypothetical protein Y032_0864g2754 [Ancylostoma ceylanicum]
MRPTVVILCVLVCLCAAGPQRSSRINYKCTDPEEVEVEIWCKPKTKYSYVDSVKECFKVTCCECNPNQHLFDTKEECEKTCIPK